MPRETRSLGNTYKKWKRRETGYRAEGDIGKQKGRGIDGLMEYEKAY